VECAERYQILFSELWGLFSVIKYTEVELDAKTRKSSSARLSEELLPRQAAFLIAASSYGLGLKERALRRAEAEQSERSIADGRQVFESRCAGCHGIDGRGGERAPDIATSAKTQRRSDSALAQIINNGIPAAGMPASARLMVPPAER